MNCNKCGEAVAPGDERDHQNQIVCEDCYMIALSPMKTCDPWAVHSAKGCEKLTGQTQHFTQIQEEILQLLTVKGSMKSADLQVKLPGNMLLEELEREISTLHHMEKVKAEKQGPYIVWKLW